MRLNGYAKFGFLIALLLCIVCSPSTAQIRTLYVIPSSHWDRGFIAPPKEVAHRVQAQINEVIDDAVADPNFRWTIESIWQLNSWLSQDPDAKRIELLRKLIQEGHVEVSGVYGSMHTEFMGAEEMNLLTQDGFRVARRLSIAKPDFAMMDDVPGFTRWLPQVLAGSGIRFFLNGSNLFIGGGTSLAPAHVPFYWEAPDGSRVLTWVSEDRKGGYTEGLVNYYLAPRARNPYPPHEYLVPKKLWGKPPLEVMRIGIEDLLHHYQKAGYRYDAVLVMFMHDFISPSVEEKDLLPVVREWNNSGRTPKIRVTIPKEFFDHILAKYRDQIPTYAGDWTGLWAEVKTNSPGISAIARQDQMNLRADSLLWGALKLQNQAEFPSGNFHQDYRRVWNYDEHNGAGGVGWPGILTVREVEAQNQQYVDYVKHAEEDQQFLLATAIKKECERFCCSASIGSASHGPWLAVYRPESWAGPAVIRVPEFPEARRVRALKNLSSGKTFDVQWVRGKGVMVASLPSVGIELFMLKQQSTAPPRANEQTQELMLENRYYRLELRPSDGSIAHLIDRESGREIANAAGRDKFNELIRLSGFKRMAGIRGAVTFHVIHGPVFDSIEVLRSGSYEPVTEYRLFHKLKQLEIRNLLDRSRMPVATSSRHANAFIFAFPLLPCDPIKSFEYESGFGMTRFPTDYLPGARMDAVVSHGLVFSAGQFDVAIASPQAFFWEVPRLNQRNWRLRHNEVLSLVWRTNNSGRTRDYGRYIFTTVEPGLSTRQWFDYELSSWSGPWSDGEAYRKIWDMVMGPFSEVATQLPANSLREPERSFFKTDQPDVVVVAVEPSLSRSGAVVLRLQNVSGRQHLTLVSLPASNLEATQVSLAENPVGAGHLPVHGDQLEVEIGRHATVSILLSHPAKQ